MVENLLGYVQWSGDSKEIFFFFFFSFASEKGISDRALVLHHLSPSVELQAATSLEAINDGSLRCIFLLSDETYFSMADKVNVRKLLICVHTFGTAFVEDFPGSTQK